MLLEVSLFGFSVFSVALFVGEPEIAVVDNTGGDFEISEQLPFGFVLPDEEDDEED